MKTRLAAEIGQDEALKFYRSCLATLLERVMSGLAWNTVAAVNPDEASDDLSAWPAGLSLAPQGGGDLGARMMRQLEGASSDRPVVIVGSDVPDLAAADVAAAFAALATHDLVIGPASDGGYWLIGASRPPPASLFDDVRWSTATARGDTLRNARGLDVALLRELEDVDDGPSYARWRERRSRAAGGAS